MKNMSRPGFIYSVEINGKRLPPKRNIITDEGLNYLNDASLTGGTPITDFYLLLFDSNYTPLGTEAYTTPGFVEYTGYTEATRVLWDNAGTLNGEATNAANPAQFSVANETESPITIYGTAIVGGGSAPDTKGDIAGGGILLSIGRFPFAQLINPGNTIISVTATHRMKR